MSAEDTSGEDTSGEDTTAMGTSSDPDSNRIVPKWVTPQPLTNYGHRMYTIGIGSVLAAEVIGKKFDILRPSMVINSCKPLIEKVLEHLGYAVAYCSDIAYVFRKLFNFMYDYLLPIYWDVRDAVCDILGGIWDLLGTAISGFFFGYSDGLQGAYNQMLSMMTSILVFAGGFLLLGFLLEGIGLKRGIRTIRPSYYIVKCFANPVYGLTHSVVYSYTKIGCVLSNIRDFIEHIIQWFMPWIRPYVIMARQGKAYIDRAARDLLEAPIQGIVHGFTEALTQHRFLTACITGTLLAGTGYIIYNYV